jgi:hypothetical protein
MVQVGGETALILAAENDAVDVLETLLCAGAAVNLQRNNGDTALSAAAGHDHHRSAALLLRHGAREDLASKDGSTALLRASAAGGEQTVALILATPGAARSAGSQDRAGVNAVIAAAQANRHGCLDRLLRAGCSPDALTAEAESAIMLTARFESHLPCSKVTTTQMIESPQRAEAFDLTCRAGMFWCVCIVGAMTKLLLDSGCNLEFTNASGDSVLHLAARFGNTKLVLLLAEGNRAAPARAQPAQLNANGDTGLMLAVAQVRLYLWGSHAAGSVVCPWDARR